MIYRVYEHYYNDDFYTFEEKNDECFICFQTSNENEYKPICLINQCYYIKQCNCNVWVHRKCLEMWLRKSHKCPICRIEVSEYIHIQYNIYQSLFRTLKTILKIIKFIFLFIFLYTFFHFYMSLFFIHNLKNIDELRREELKNQYLKLQQLKFKDLNKIGYEITDKKFIRNITNKIIVHPMCYD